MIRVILSSILLILLTTCSNEIPLNQDDICKMLDDNPSWKKPLLDTEKKWGAKPSTVMAIIKQESSFDSRAAPDREKILWVFTDGDLRRCIEKDVNLSTKAKNLAHKFPTTIKSYEKVCVLKSPGPE